MEPGGLDSIVRCREVRPLRDDLIQLDDGGGLLQRQPQALGLGVGRLAAGVAEQSLKEAQLPRAEHAPSG